MKEDLSAQYDTRSWKKLENFMNSV